MKAKRMAWGLAVSTALLMSTASCQGPVHATGQAGDRKPGELVRSAGDTVGDLLPIADVLQRQTTSLMTIHGVSGTGEGRDKHGKAVIVVYVSPQITREDRLRIPKTVQGYEVEIRESGNVTAPPGRG